MTDEVRVRGLERKRSGALSEETKMESVCVFSLFSLEFQAGSEETVTTSQGASEDHEFFLLLD